MAEPRRFGVGERVRVRVANPPWHTRVPRYIRGRQGTVERVHGEFPLPDASALADADPPVEAVYVVVFRSDELWGPDGHPNDRISVDLWDSYLEPAPREDASR